jgi:hypothetical protein
MWYSVGIMGKKKRQCISKTNFWTASPFAEDKFRWIMCHPHRLKTFCQCFKVYVKDALHFVKFLPEQSITPSMQGSKELPIRCFLSFSNKSQPFKILPAGYERWLAWLEELGSTHWTHITRMGSFWVFTLHILVWAKRRSFCSPLKNKNKKKTKKASTVQQNLGCP